MSLIEQTLFGEISKVEIAIERLRAFESLALDYNKMGYYVADSGGKDSTVIKHLCRLAGVSHEIAHNHTTADHPETVYFIKKERDRAIADGIKYSIRYPCYKGERTSMWKLIEQKGLPTRLQRWCCEILKESGGENRVVVTGVRWAESVRRKKDRGIAEVISAEKKNSIILKNDNSENRKVLENCTVKGKKIVNPIVDWLDEDVWEYINKYKLSYNPLYDMGRKRVGCIGCPMNSKLVVELDNYPVYKNMYIKAADKYLQRLKEKRDDVEWESGEDIYNWWTGNIPSKQIEGQISLFKKRRE